MTSFFNMHPQLEGKHAFLPASQSSWLRYDDEKMLDRLETRNAAAHGTRLHSWAAETISLGLKQPDTTQTLNQYINDAIGFRMTPELVLFATGIAFGTADTLSFRPEPGYDIGMLRVHDLKTGANPAGFEQLEVYCAFFCIEYNYSPFDIGMELRIYQNDEVKIHVPEALTINEIISKIRHFDELVTKARMEALD